MPEVGTWDKKEVKDIDLAYGWASATVTRRETDSRRRAELSMGPEVEDVQGVC